MLRGRVIKQAVHVAACVRRFLRTLYNSCQIGTSLLSSTGTPSPLLLRKILKTNQIGFCLCFDLLFSRGYRQNLELIGVTGAAWAFFQTVLGIRLASPGAAVAPGIDRLRLVGC